jgi:hypothetical protein
MPAEDRQPGHRIGLLPLKQGRNMVCSWSTAVLDAAGALVMSGLLDEFCPRFLGLLL